MFLKKIRTKGFLGHLASEDNDFVELDFGDKNLWLIHGENGAGKSSFFDAITMAFFKQHRGGKINFTNLIHDRAERAEIFIEFELHGKDYQVAVDIPKKSTVVRRLQFWNGANWETKNDSVEDWMAKNLKISYKTFVSSVVLRQGEADKFILETPTARREIFLELLQLEFYKKLTERAKNRQKCVGDRVRDIKQSLEGLPNPSATDIKNQEKVVKQLGKELEKLEIEKTFKQKELDNAIRAGELNAEIEKIQDQQKSDYKLFENATDVREKYEHYVELERVLFGFDKVWREKDEIEKIITDLQASEGKILKLAEDVKAAAEKSSEIFIIRDAAKLKFTELENEVQNVKDERAILKQKLNDIERIKKLEHQAAQASELLSKAQLGISAANKKVTEFEAKVEIKAKEKDNLENFIQESKSDLRIWSERLENRRKVVDQDECPVCGNELTRDAVRRKLVADFEDAREKIDELEKLQSESKRKLAQIVVEFSALKEELKLESEKRQTALQSESSAKSRIETLQTQIDDLPHFDGVHRAKIERDFTTLQSMLVKVENQFIVSKENFEQIVKQLKESEKLQALLESDLQNSTQYCESLQTRKRDAETRLAEANNQVLPKWSDHAALQSKNELEILRLERTNLQGIEIEHRDLLEAEKRAAHLKGRLETLETQFQKIPENHRRETAQVEAEFNETNEKTKTQKQQFGESETGCRKMLAERENYIEKSGELKAIQKDFEMWKILAKTLGKEGLETKIVREAQHKISENANKTLKALSNGNFQLEMEDSGKEMKIFVRDFTTGEQRQIEYFSGGEKFLTAVSLAIAIGQSASGQNITNTLIIDEGFGALDDKNRVLMVNELSRLTEVFKNGRVIIVSHQDDVQENFANRFRLSKNDEGFTSVETGIRL